MTVAYQSNRAFGSILRQFKLQWMGFPSCQENSEHKRAEAEHKIAQHATNRVA